MSDIKLDDRPARTDLTNREITKILGGVIGGLVHLSDIKTVRESMRWWAEQDEAWEQFELLLRYMEKDMETEKPRSIFQKEDT